MRPPWTSGVEGDPVLLEPTRDLAFVVVRFARKSRDRIGSQRELTGLRVAQELAGHQWNVEQLMVLVPAVEGDLPIRPVVQNRLVGGGHDIAGIAPTHREDRVAAGFERFLEVRVFVVRVASLVRHHDDVADVEDAKVWQRLVGVQARVGVLRKGTRAAFRGL